MRTKLSLALMILLLAGAAGWFLYPKIFPAKQDRVPASESDSTGFSSTQKIRRDEYYCPMHPQVVRDKPGACDICGMTLVKRVVESSTGRESATGVNRVVVSPSRQVLAQVATTVARRKPGLKTIRAVGRIEYAETGFRQISARFPGRVEKLYVSFIGEQIRKGDPVAEMYSPEAISAQQEYLLASDSYVEVKDAPEMISGGAKSLADQSREKLVQWGFTEAQIARLESTKSVQNVVTIYSPIGGTVIKKNTDPQHYAAAGEDLFDVADLSRVWMEADFYEVEMKWLKVGQAVTAASDAFPGRGFSGKVSFISPVVDPATRTVAVRVELANPGELLKPGMYLNARATVPLSPALLVPATAVLSTGNRTVVWVQTAPDLFEAREVRRGERVGDDVQILEGLEEGDRVVISGGYLLDSESQLQEATPAS